MAVTDHRHPPVSFAHPSASMNLDDRGVEGDDELDYDRNGVRNVKGEEDGDADEDDEDEEEDEEEEEEEEEPRLKYQRLGGSIPSLLSSDAASSITISERMIALGTHDGTLHILDYQGNQVKEFRSHSSTVNELSFDIDGEYIGSCSDDGSIVINSLYGQEQEKFEYHRPMKAVALDPDYARNSSKRFVAGGLAGQLILNTKGWFGNRDQVLHSGEGPVHAAKWRTSLIAWANDSGVKVYDTASNQRLTFIERPRGSPHAELLRPHLVWQDDTFLVIGWADSIKVMAIRSKESSQTDKQGVGRKGVPISGAKYVEIVAAFQTDYYISGLAPYGNALVVLAYIQEKDEDQAKRDGSLPRQGHAQRPEVRIVTWKNEDLATDALSVYGYEHYKAKDYALAHAPFSGSSFAGGQWAAGDEPLYFIVSPKDVVVAKPRDAEDHVNWLLQHGWHEKALAAVEAGKARTELLDEVGSRYLDHLILERRYAEAAALCPKVLRGSAGSWERWVFHFAHLRQLPILAPYIPTKNPQLRDNVYEVVLNALIANPAYHEQLLSTIKLWPTSVYSVSAIIIAMETQLATATKSVHLQEALATLYLENKQHDKAIALLIELMKPGVLDLIEQYSLYSSLHDKVLPLIKLEGKKAVHLLMQHWHEISPVEVVTQLQKAEKDDYYRNLLHFYLHELFEKDPNAGKDFHYLQVGLYAEYEPRLLLPFLRSSHYYSLDKAYEVCKQRGLTREQVFILGRMGNSREALSLIIKKLKDMQEAVEFVAAQNDTELWEELINLSLSNPEMIGALFEYTVGNIDPLHLINKVPNGMRIPRLRDRLVRIITDYRTETSLRRGCNNILKADCVALLVRYYTEARNGIFVGSKVGIGKNIDGKFSQAVVKDSDTDKVGRMASNMGGSGRCCICLDPVALQNVSIVSFFCTHTYHVTCLTDSDTSGTHSDENGDTSMNGVVDGDSSGSQMRCILCTTAAASKKNKG